GTRRRQISCTRDFLGAAMPIDLTCTCGRALVLRDELAGKVVRCPECQAELTVPAAAVVHPDPEPVLDVLPADPPAIRAEAPSPPSPRRRSDFGDERRRLPDPAGAKCGGGGGWFGWINAGVGGGLLTT